MASCQGNVKNEIEKEHPEASDGIAGCYLSVFGKDSTILELRDEKDSISGNLNYHWFQKDNNTGYFSGTLEDSLLSGFYNFYSEGKYSVRQIVFKVKNDTLLEGYGPIEMKNDTAFFTKAAGLHYMYQRPLVKRECSVEPSE